MREKARFAPDDPDFALIEDALADVYLLSGSSRLHESQCRSAGVEISRTNLRFLSCVRELGPVAVSKVARLMDMSLPTASRALRRLEDDGLVVRGGDPADARVAMFDVTREGEKVFQKIRRVQKEELARALDALPARRRHEIALALTELIRHLRGDTDRRN